MVTAEELQGKTISELAELIASDWKTQLKEGDTLKRSPKSYAAYPYLEAMLDLQSINDNYGMDSGKSIVLYFLGNAQMYRGEQAKLIKAELKRRCGK